MTGSVVRNSPERRALDDLRAGRSSAEDALSAARDRLAVLAPTNALVRPPDPSAVAVAVALDEHLAVAGPVGPLHGLPVVVKDNIAVAGLVEAGASPALADHRPVRHAGAVARLVAAGAVIAAQTNMHELALGTTSDNRFHGPVRNPWSLAHSAGGSSGGTAAAVGGGGVLVGLGTDTGGSGRIPAALCGCVGFRPSTGRYPDDGVLTLSTTMDTVSVMSRTVDGVAILDAVLSGALGRGDAVPARTPPADVALLRLGVPRAAFWADLDPEVGKVCENALERLAAAGATLVDVDLTDVRALDAQVSGAIVPYEMRAFWSRLLTGLERTMDDLADAVASPDVAARVRGAARASMEGAEYRRLTALCAAARQRFAAVHAEHALDAVVLPPLPCKAPGIGSDTVVVGGRVLSAFAAMTSHETPASIAGIPAISLPAGLDATGLPVGLELDGVHGDDSRLLAVAAAVEAVLPALPAPTAVGFAA